MLEINDEKYEIGERCYRSSILCIREQNEANGKSYSLHMIADGQDAVA